MRPARIATDNLEQPRPNVGPRGSSVFNSLQQACEELADIQGVEVQHIAESLAAAIHRRVEFEVLKLNLDARWREG